MFGYRLLTDCPPGKDCPKVAVAVDGAVVVVGARITDLDELSALGVGPGEAAVRITGTMYRAGYDGLDREDGEAA